MTNRVSFSSSGLLISKAGVDVTTAARKDLLFRAADRSMPILAKLSGFLPASFTSGLTLTYPKTFSSIPLSIVYYTASQPASTSPLFVLSGLGSQNDYSWPWDYNSSSGNTAMISVSKYVDKIIVKNEYDSSSSGISPTAGWISAVLFDYG